MAGDKKVEKKGKKKCWKNNKLAKEIIKFFFVLICVDSKEWN